MKILWRVTKIQVCLRPDQSYDTRAAQFLSMSNTAGGEQWDPTAVADLPDGVIALSAGLYQTCALTASGSVWCWGDNGYGVLGDGSSTMRTHPVDVVGLCNPITQIDASWSHTCGVTAGGGVRCWGANRHYALGVRHPAHSFTSPVTVRGFLGSDDPAS